MLICFLNLRVSSVVVCRLVSYVPVGRENPLNESISSKFTTAIYHNTACKSSRHGGDNIERTTNEGV
jgi:hypothetical protein